MSDEAPLWVSTGHPIDGFTRRHLPDCEIFYYDPPPRLVKANEMELKVCDYCANRVARIGASR